MKDSFYVHPGKSTYDRSRKRYLASIDRPVHIKDTYQFIIAGQQPYILSDMKMIMWAQYTMYAEGYGCVMGDFKLNGQRFEHDANPDLIKKGFRFSWEK